PAELLAVTGGSWPCSSPYFSTAAVLAERALTWAARFEASGRLNARLPRRVHSALGRSPFGGQRLVPQRLALPGHVLGAKVTLRRERVVRRAVQGQVGGRMRAQLAERVSVVKLQPVRFTAACAAL